MGRARALGLAGVLALLACGQAVTAPSYPTSAWCTACEAELLQIISEYQAVAAEKVTVLQLLLDGGSFGVPATVADLDTWVDNFKPPFTVALDPGARALKAFFDPSTLPWNADIDLRTMVILEAARGAPDDFRAEVEGWLSWIDAHPVSP